MAKEFINEQANLRRKVRNTVEHSFYFSLAEIRKVGDPGFWGGRGASLCGTNPLTGYEMHILLFFPPPLISVLIDPSISDLSSTILLSIAQLAERWTVIVTSIIHRSPVQIRLGRLPMLSYTPGVSFLDFLYTWCIATEQQFYVHCLGNIHIRFMGSFPPYGRSLLFSYPLAALIPRQFQRCQAKAGERPRRFIVMFCSRLRARRWSVAFSLGSGLLSPWRAMDWHADAPASVAGDPSTPSTGAGGDGGPDISMETVAR